MPDKVMVVCATCGLSFESIIVNMKSEGDSYCSQACYENSKPYLIP